MTEQNPDDTGVWRHPAAGEPSWFTPSKRVPRPDARVWPPPPPPSEPPGSSTVPIPVVRHASRNQPWPPPARPMAVPPAMPEAPAPRPPEPPVEAAFAPEPASEPTPVPVAARRRRRRRPMPKAAKIGIQFSGAVILACAFVGVRGYDALGQYREKVPAASERHVPKGRSAPLGNATWRLVGIALAPSQFQTPETPDREMMQIEVEATGLNADAKYYTSSLPGFYLSDKAGRMWLALASKTPEELGAGKTGRFTLMSAVPKALEDQVELVMWPSEHEGKDQSGPSLRFAR
ncbi:hypothetical protein [Sphaerisporangium album]|uniref:hypothetical protein n=1 Tax=Sphaerisporangium album TaxID=509200 RepID=UPI0011C060A7|nr:hypothetical protein [Sphaerisporangium album]